MYERNVLAISLLMLAAVANLGATPAAASAITRDLLPINRGADDGQVPVGSHHAQR